jgi:hypothetical protein
LFLFGWMNKNPLCRKHSGFFVVLNDYQSSSIGSAVSAKYVDRQA